MGTDRFILGAPDLVAVRFSIAPGMEAARAIRRLSSPQSTPLHRALLARIRAATSAEVLAVLRPLAGARGYTPDFVSQPGATTPEDVLAGIHATPAGIVVDELRRACAEGRTIPGDWLADPESARSQIGEAWEVFWSRGMSPHWSLLRGVLEADTATRSRRLASVGLQAVVEDLDPRLRWDGTAVLRTESRFAITTDCRGRGLCLSPTVLGWPRGAIVTDPPWTPTIYYPARHATAIPRGGHGAGSPAAALMGATRAAILEHLRVPARTMDVATALTISAATASHHLHVLAAAGLVTTTRRGKEAWHARTLAPDELGW